MSLANLLTKVELYSKFTYIPACVIQDNKQVVYCSYGAKKISTISIFKYIDKIEDHLACPLFVVYNGFELYFIFDILEKASNYRFLIGPVLTMRPVHKENFSLLSFYSLFPIDKVSEFIRILPQMSQARFLNSIEMLHFSLVERKCAFNDISKRKVVIESPALTDTEFAEDTHQNPYRSHLIDNEYYEKVLFALETGNSKDMAALTSHDVLYDKLVGVDMHENFARFVATTTLFAQTAQKSVLSYNDVESIAVTFIKYAENLLSRSEYINLYKTMALGFTHRVEEFKIRRQYAPAVKKAIDFIEENIQRTLSLEEIANHVALSRSYFSQLFAKETGKPLNHFLKQQKVDQATKLLKYTQMPISEISQSLDFCSQSYFTEVFKEITGKTPVTFRKQFHSHP
jgi:AraC-like DNA-binding protein